MSADNPKEWQRRRSEVPEDDPALPEPPLKDFEYDPNNPLAFTDPQLESKKNAIRVQAQEYGVKPSDLINAALLEKIKKKLKKGAKKSVIREELMEKGLTEKEANKLLGKAEIQQKQVKHIPLVNLIGGFALAFLGILIMVGSATENGAYVGSSMVVGGVSLIGLGIFRLMSGVEEPG